MYLASEFIFSLSFLFTQGGIIGIIIDWSCDLDWWSGKCYPKYSFRRMDDKDPVNNVAPGFNFRLNQHY